ncbi:MAG: hypothetical protein N2C14_18835 [Planctomycetales bacterium]
MMKLESAAIIKEIDSVLKDCHKAIKATPHRNASGLSVPELSRLQALMSHTINRFTEHGNAFRTQAQKVLDDSSGPCHYYIDIPCLLGILQGLQTAYENNYLESVQELVHADLFVDFLEMAEYLLSENYKDAAAVIVGSTLEEHLRKLSVKHALPIQSPEGKPFAGARLNDGLKKGEVYDRLEHKNVTAWLDLRNKAAHGEYDEYNKSHVKNLIRNVTTFINQFRA